MEQRAEEFVRIRLEIATDPLASPADRLRAMEQLEARALGRPTEHVEHRAVQTPASIEAFRALSLEEKLAHLAERRRLRAIGD